MADFGDIGGVYDSAGAAVANRNLLVAFLANRADKSAALYFGGPKDPIYGRQPGTVYIDLSIGAIVITVGGAGFPTNLLFDGLSRIKGINSPNGIEPLFRITRSAGTTPHITLRNLQIDSDGSGIEFQTPGATTRLENINVVQTGTGTFTHDDWTDLDTSPFALKIVDADGLWISGFSHSNGKGHGVIVKRWHAGKFQASIRECDGAAIKGEKINGVDLQLRAESNKGFGAMFRDCGVDRYSGGGMVASAGAPNKWREVWFESNNSRGSAWGTGSIGHRYSQFRMDNCARVEWDGKTGWRANKCRIDVISRLRNVFLEARTTPMSKPANFELVTGNAVDSTITLPAAGFGNLAITNWDATWTNAAFRPTAVKFGSVGVDERIRITWPANCFQNYAVLQSSYWRPWGLSPLSSPGSYYFEAEVKSVNSNAPNYSIAREAASNRQTPDLMLAQIAPISGGTVGIALWDQEKRKISGEIRIDDTRADINPAVIAFASGMHDQQGNAPQSTEHIIDLYQLRVWKLST